MRQLCLGLALLAGLGVALCVPGTAAEKGDAEEITKLIDKLSSSRFVDREKAHKALEQIGLPALDALKKVAQTSEDPEARGRAGELVEKLEKQVSSARILAPKRLHLVYKDTPLPEAIEDFKKKSGYSFTLLDPENKLKDRKITLDTGETSFWQAYDLFCAKAGLVEATAQDMIQGFPVPLPVPVPPQPPQILPGVVPGNAVPGAPGKPVRPIRRLPLERQVPPQLPQKELNAAFQVALPVQAAAQPGNAPAVQPVPPIQGIAVRPFRPVITQPGQILLKDGKATPLPTVYSGAVRVQVLADAQQLFGAGPNGELLLALRVTPEPKIQWQQFVALRIDKAVDDQDQSLPQAMDMGPNGPIGPFGVPGIGFKGGFGGGFARPAILPVGVGASAQHQLIPVRLKKGEKAARSLKELTGTVTATVLSEPEVYIEADKVLKAAGQTFKGAGKDGGSFKINGIAENNGQITLRVELTQPANVVPAFQQQPQIWDIPQILPVLPPQVLPVPAPAPAPALPPGAFQVQIQAKAQQPAVARKPVQVQIQQIQIGGGGVVQIGIAPAFFGGSSNGLELQDEKGNPIPCVGSGGVGRVGPGGNAEVEHHMTFQPQKDQKPAKLVFKGSKRVTIEVPFTFKDVKLP